MKKLLVVALAGALAVVACDDKKGDAPAPGASGSTKPAPSGDTKPAKSTEAPAAAKALTLAEFATDVPAAACKALVGCKNEEISVSLGTSMIFMAGIAGMDDAKLGEEMKAIGDNMKKDKRYVLNADECSKVMAAVTKASAFTPEKLQAAVDAKKVEFNGEKAGACLAQLATEPSFCKEEKKLTGEPKLDDIDKMMKTYEKDFEAYMKGCNEALVGKLAAGAACEQDYECAGEKSDCKQKKCAEKAK